MSAEYDEFKREMTDIVSRMKTFFALTANTKFFKPGMLKGNNGLSFSMLTFFKKFSRIGSKSFPILEKGSGSEDYNRNEIRLLLKIKANLIMLEKLTSEWAENKYQAPVENNETQQKQQEIQQDNAYRKQEVDTINRWNRTANDQDKEDKI